MNQESQMNKPVEAFLRIVFLSLILAWCFLIARPFLVLVVWACIISVAIYPMYKRMLKWFRNRAWLAILAMSVFVLILIAIPSVHVAKSIASHTADFQSFFVDPESQIPAPDPSVAQWPVIGEKVYKLWAEAKAGISEFVSNHQEQVTEVAGWLVGVVANIMKDFMLTLGSLALALVFLYFHEAAFKGINRFAKRLASAKGEDFVLTARDTIRSVVQGVLVVALLQAILLYLGCSVMGFQAAPVVGLLALIVAILQLPLLLLTIPMAIYAFSVAETGHAIIFAVFVLLVGMLDNVLKPILMGRGVNVPMAVVFIGSLGGMMLHGMVGLFVGSVVLAIGYELYRNWLGEATDLEAETETD